MAHILSHALQIEITYRDEGTIFIINRMDRLNNKEN